MLVSSRVTNILLVILIAIGIGIVAMLATGVRGGPLDPPGGAPSSTDSVKLPGTPVSGQTFIDAPGYYYLTRDIVVSGGETAIWIASSNVSLDLGGFTVRGNDAIGSYGVLVSGPRTDITVRNGTIRDFAFGIDAGTDERVLIEDVTVTSNVTGVAVGVSGVLSNCVSDSNTGTGVSLTGFYAVVRHCVVQGNGGDGISVNFDNVVEFSVVKGNQLAVRLLGSNNVVRDNVVAGTIRIENPALGNRILDNTCADVGGIDDASSGGTTSLSNNFQC